MNELKNLIMKYKKTSGSVVAVPLLMVLVIFAPSPKDIVYADLDKRYAMNEQIQQSEQRILNRIDDKDIHDLENQIYDLETLELEGKATPREIAKKQMLIRQLDSLRRE